MSALFAFVPVRVLFRWRGAVPTVEEGATSFRPFGFIWRCAVEVLCVDFIFLRFNLHTLSWFGQLRK